MDTDVLLDLASWSVVVSGVMIFSARRREIERERQVIAVFRYLVAHQTRLLHSPVHLCKILRPYHTIITSNLKRPFLQFSRKTNPVPILFRSCSTYMSAFFPAGYLEPLVDEGDNWNTLTRG